MTLSADVTLLPSDVDHDLSRELIALLDHEPETVAAQVRVWMLEEAA